MTGVQTCALPIFLIICTPRYKQRADRRVGGVGYEGDIMTAEVFVKKSPRRQRKFIPILRSGTWEQSAPSWLRGKYYISLDGESYSEKNYDDLLMTLHDARPEPPVPGRVRCSRRSEGRFRRSAGSVRE